MKNYLLLITLEIFLFSSCKSKLNFEDKNWNGSIYKSDDNRKLAKMFCSVKNDSIFIYSDAVFGAKNDTLLIDKKASNDSVVSCLSKDGESISLRFIYTKGDNKTESLKIIGDDYYCELNISNEIHTKQIVNKYYSNIEVPQHTYQYLYGAYEGSIEYDNAINGYYMSMLLGDMNLKLVFEDNFDVKLMGNMGGFITPNKSATKNYYYRIENDKLFLYDNGNKPFMKEGFIVQDNGNALVMIAESQKLVLRKIY